VIEKKGHTNLVVRERVWRWFWGEFSTAWSALREVQGWTTGGRREVLILPSEQELSRLGELEPNLLFRVVICMKCMRIWMHVFWYFIYFCVFCNYFWVIRGYRDGTAWRHVLNRQAMHVVVPSFLGFMKGLAVTNTRQATQATFGLILMFHRFWEVFDRWEIVF